MNTALQPSLLSVDEYLAGEGQSPFKHEYIDGEVFAMAGASAAHNLIALGFASLLRGRLRGGPCRVFMSDFKVRIEVDNGDFVYYPDVMVTCDPRDTGSIYAKYPKVIVEVLSDSTERTDRGEKFWSYVRIETLEEYVLAAQDRIEVRVFRRSNDWKPELYSDPGQELELQSLRLRIALRDIYEGLTFPSLPQD
jgi:Uma2 family endonuclease